jgi:hypothetical protein
VEMGSSASADLKTHALCPLCFDIDNSYDQNNPRVVHYRPSSIGAWLAHWEVEEIQSHLSAFGLRSPLQARRLTAAHMASIEQAFTNPSSRRKWLTAMNHVSHLADGTSAFDSLGSSSLFLWLESWRLSRLKGDFEKKLKCKSRADVLLVTTFDIEAIGLRPLELRRWHRAQRLLRSGIPEEGMRSSMPSLETWLQTFELSHFTDVFLENGALEIVDVRVLEKSQLIKLGFNARDLGHLERAKASLEPVNTAPAFPSSLLEIDSIDSFSLRGWLERFVDCHTLSRCDLQII